MSKEKVGDAVYGDGVYLTSMGPHEATEFLIMNNWGLNPLNHPDNRDDYMVLAFVASTEWYFEFDSSLLPSAQKHIHTHEFPELGIIFFRDIWNYPGRDLPIGNIKAQRRDAKGYGYHVERGTVRNLTDAENLMCVSNLKKFRPFITKRENLQKYKNENWKNTTSQRSNGQDGRIGINMKVKKLQRNKSNAESNAEKTCEVFHSVQVAEKIKKEENQGRKMWKRVKKIFHLNGDSHSEEKENNKNEDGIDGPNCDYDEQESDLSDEEMNENLCFLCFINIFCF